MPNSPDDIKQEIIEKTQYILFLSVDIINSTQFKQENEWGDIFDKFYDSFTLDLMNICSKGNLLDSSINLDNVPKPEFWKYLGDEIIYKVIIKDKLYLAYYLDSFRTALHDYREREFKDLNLDLKATAWTAGFPIKNSIVNTKIPFNKDMIVDNKNNSAKEIVMNSNDSPSSYNLIDYIGPSMDIGFRITKFSSDNKFIIGRSLFLLLLESKKTDSFKIYFDGKKDIKGVRYPYSIIWINMKKDASRSTEDSLINKGPIENLDNLKNYLLENNNNKKIDEPYIINEIKDITNQYLEDYRKKFKPEKIDDNALGGNEGDIQISRDE